MKRIIFSALLLCMSMMGFAQGMLVKGVIKDKNTNKPLPDVSISIIELKLITSTDENGEFTLSNVEPGTYDAVISVNGVDEEEVKIEVASGITQLEPILVENKVVQDVWVTDNSATGIEDATSESDNSSISTGQNISSVLNAARDPFLSAAAFGWGQFFFRNRGYENDHNILFLNGLPLNDLEEGGIFYNTMSGLNDVFRGRSNILGLAPNNENFGGLGLNSGIDASASSQMKQTRITYSLTNRSYRNRLMLTHSSGLNKNGWAYSFSLSRRWANHGPIKGTFYDAYGYFAAVEKVIKNHSLNLMYFASPQKRGKNGPATLEAFELYGSNYYNPYWGYQGGTGKDHIRNARVKTTNLPLLALSHKWEVNSTTMLNTSVGYQFGETNTTNIDWFNAADPRPDYYRYMPSYYEGTEREEVYAKIKADPEKYMQIDWDRLYEANALNKIGGYGRSVYAIGADVEKSKQIMANMTFNKFVDDHINIQAGILYQNLKNNYFKRMEDLLGGDYWVNRNQFAERTFASDPDAAQLDLNNPDKVVKIGDDYSYNYDMFFSRAALFAQGIFTYNRVDFFLAGELGNTNFMRVGNYKHGLYAQNSFGESQKLKFNTYRVKGGATYKLNGRNYLYVNGALGTRPPLMDNIFISPRTRNEIIENPVVETFQSLEAGYLLRSPNVRARLTGYVTESKNSSDIRRYYNGDLFSFANMAIQGINKRYTGIEFGTEIKMSPSLSVNLAASLGQAYYTNRPTAGSYVDNDTSSLSSLSAVGDTVYIQNFYLNAGPQTDLQLNLFYRSKKYWFGSLTANYCAGKWLDFAPTRRTVRSADIVDRNSAEYSTLINQLRVDPFFTIDAFLGKSFLIQKYVKSAPYSMRLYVNLGVNNILNNRNIPLYGFENLRVGDNATENQEWFAPKYAYTLGTQYFINIAFKF